MSVVITGSMITVELGTEVSKFAIGRDTVIVSPSGASGELIAPLARAEVFGSPWNPTSLVIKLLLE